MLKERERKRQSESLAEVESQGGYGRRRERGVTTDGQNASRLAPSGPCVSSWPGTPYLFREKYLYRAAPRSVLTPDQRFSRSRMLRSSKKKQRCVVKRLLCLRVGLPEGRETPVGIDIVAHEVAETGIAFNERL